MASGARKVAEEFTANALREMESRTNRLMRAVGLEALKRIVMRTAVDTGRARANWNVSIDVVDGSYGPEREARAGGESVAARAAKALQEAIDRGTVSIVKVDFFKGQVLYIANGIPYILPLEDGSSSQHPQGMVGVTIEEMRLFAEEIGAQLGRGD